MVDVPAPAPTAGVTALPSRFGALRLPSYRVLWFSGAFMFFAVQAQQVARSWLAIEITGTNAGLGGVYLSFGLPMLLLSPLGGVLADRFAKRTVLVACQSTILVGALFVSIAVELDILEYWMLIVTAAMHGAGMAAMVPTRMAYNSEVVERSLLANAVMLQQMAANSTRVIGPAIAGALIGVKTIGAGGVYILTSAMIVVAICVSSLLPKGEPRRTTALQSAGKDLAEGLRYLRSRRQVFLLVVVSVTVGMIGFVYLAFLPSLAKSTFDVGSSGYGLMSMAGAVGALATSFWIAGRVTSTSVWRMQAVCGTMFGVAIVLLGLAPAFVVALAVLVLVGGAAAGFQATNSSLVLTETAHEYHGRMQALMVPAFAGSAIVALPLGFVADAIGLRETLVIMGVVMVATMAVYGVARRRSTGEPAEKEPTAW